ncbi:type II restriction endonuclease [Pantoea septica]|uniref:type II restriction endonuclease n=1 Tax=Pantoea septica TaxID=472695 RepID=UPI00289E5324|nr:type II restriction endonuclease [Pantoea septica]
MKTQSLKNACIKSVSKSELYDQKEFNGVNALKSILGYSGDKEFKAYFYYGGDDKRYEVNMTWYDARLSHDTRSEFRLYYESNDVMSSAQPGDNIVVGFDKNNNFTCILYKTNHEDYQGPVEEWMTIK